MNNSRQLILIALLTIGGRGGRSRLRGMDKDRGYQLPSTKSLVDYLCLMDPVELHPVPEGLCAQQVYKCFQISFTKSFC